MSARNPLTRKAFLVLAFAAAAAAAILFAFVIPSERLPADPVAELRHGEKEHGTSGAMEALDFWAAPRAYPLPAIPDVGYALAWEEERTRQLRGAPGIDAMTSAWTSLGPANVGGRTLALAIRPDDTNIIFAGAASGGLWKTTTGGVGAYAWQYVETGYPTPGVSAIALDPQDPDVMYLGTGEVYRYQGTDGGRVIRTTRGSYGIGILKSTDGGATWTKSLDWSLAQSRAVAAIRVNPLHPDVVYAATTEGVYRSTDAGGSWTQVHNVIMAMDLAVHPVTPETLFVSCGDLGSTGNGIYRSYDGGGSWTKLAGGLPASWSGKTMLDIAPSLPSTMFASVADSAAGKGLYRSTNGGANWTRVTTLNYPQYQGWYSHWVSVSPVDPNRVFVGGIDVYRSVNGGTSFTKRSDWTQYYLGITAPEGPDGTANYVHADQHVAVWKPGDPNTLYLGGDGGVFRTSDGGDTFQSLNGHYVSGQFYNGFTNSATDSATAMGGLQDNFSAIYRGGDAWERCIGGDGCWSAVHPTDLNRFYGAYQYLEILRSVDGGANWAYVTPPTTGSELTSFAAPYVLSPSSPTVLYAGRTYMYKSTDGGLNWTTTNGGSPLSAGNPLLSLALSATSPDTAYAGAAAVVSRARVFRTTNGGVSWQDVTGTLPDRYPMDLAVDPANSRNVYLALSGFGSSHVWKSTNGGSSWTDIGAGLPDVPTSAVEVDPYHPSVVYAGNDLGVYVSLDAGASWSPFTTGMPTAMVSDLKVFAPTRKLRAATHGNGVYQRDLLDPTASVAAGAGAPAGEALALAVAPNPVTAESHIVFRLAESQHVRLALYDVRGRQLALLVDAVRGAGEQSVSLEPAVKSLGAGVYYARLETEAGAARTRVILAR